ncbi:MAG: hypothetical protein MI919_06070, partial [Holophagales bacterium]|nr:hypothetical protein [Holophagales bacterium]
AFKVRRSNIRVRGGSNNNWAIVLRDCPNGFHNLRETAIEGVGGLEAAGIRFLSVACSGGVLNVHNSEVVAHSGTRSIGLGDDSNSFASPIIFYRSGNLLGATHAFNLQMAEVSFANTEVKGDSVRVLAKVARVGSTWLRGGGTITGLTSLARSGGWDDSMAFYPSTCPP